MMSVATRKKRRFPDEASFLKDVADHEMAVLRDDGLYRHLRFRRPDSWVYGFDVVTWPGFLAYTGDMGCYVFSRIPDMIEFFREGKPTGPLRINPGYWGEKVEAVDRNGPLEEYDPDTFRDAVKRWMKEGRWPKAARDAAADEVLSRADDGEHEALRAALGFGHGKYNFDGFHEVGLRETGSRFLWCCFALAWSVKKYDEMKDQTP
jgi:hypothetical protein